MFLFRCIQILVQKCLNKILTHSESEILFVGKLDNFDNMRGGIPKVFTVLHIHIILKNILNGMNLLMMLVSLMKI